MQLFKSLFAALMLFTRLPLWRIGKPDKKHYANALLYWPLVGFLTGATTWGILAAGAHVMPLLPACILAIAARLILTGALHEDGLGDFFDGFGGGHDKESILRIMKDSHTGSYAIIGLIVYFMLYTSLLYSLYPMSGAVVIIGADVLSKLCTAIMITSLPYARTEETSKVRVLYRRYSVLAFAIVALICILALHTLAFLFWALLPVILTECGLRWYFRHKIGGYTGDCCGAAVLLTEQVFYLACLILYTLWL